MQSRQITLKIYEWMDEGMLSADVIAKMALSWMSEDDVKKMAEANELLFEEDDDEDEDKYSYEDEYVWDIWDHD